MKAKSIVVPLLGVVGVGVVGEVALRSMGINLLVRYGGTFWIPVHASDPWIPNSIAAALQAKPPAVTPGSFQWNEIAPGFEVAELPVNGAGIEVDRILLARVDPARYRFAVRNTPMENNNLDAWMEKLGAALVVNGSYFSRGGTPDTPTVIDGVLRGPATYRASHGAFVASSGQAEIRDIAGADWHPFLRGAETAFVSFPLLLAADGTNRVPAGSKWLANRSFIGEDDQGRILVGTTKSAFFSLDRLASFLKDAPLGLRIALNLDGGPVASQGIKLNGFDRRTYGQWEIQVQNGQAKMLPHLPFHEAPMPIVLAVYPR